MKIKILIADENKLFTELLAKRLEENTEIEIIAQAEDGPEILEKAKILTPDILLMDIGIPRLNCIETSMILRKELPNTKIIALTTHKEKIYIRSMLEVKAWGYLLKDCNFDQLVEAVYQVFEGNKYFCNDVKDIIFEDYLEHDSNKKLKLTERELEILKLLAEGKSTREISEKSFISVKTVGTHKQNIFEKLEFKNMAELIKFGLKNGIVTY